MTQFLIGILVVCLGVILTTVGGYIAKDGWEKIRHKKNELKKEGLTSAREEDKPKFVLNLGSAWFMESSEFKGSLMFIKIEVINLGSPSVIIGWQAELKLGSQITSRVLPTSIPDGLKILKDGSKLIAEFHNDNRLENKAIEEPLIKGARTSGWLMFNFTDITQEQLVNAEKTIYVHDFLNHEYSFKFKDLSPIMNTHLPGSGTPPFMP